MTAVDQDLKHRIAELRRQAASLRQSAEYTDRNSDRLRDLDPARQYENQANFLEQDVLGQ